MSEQQQNPDLAMDSGQPPHPHPGQPYAQHPAQPGQPYAPYAQPGQPSGVATPPYAPGHAAPRQGGLGRTALIVAVSAVAVGLFFQIVTPFMFMSVGYQFVDLLSNLVNFIVMLGAGAGLVLGIMALRRPAPHLLAAIAIGVGGSTVIGTLISWVSNVFYYFGF